MQRKDPHGAGPCQTQQIVLTDRKTDDALVVFQITVSLQCEIWTGGRRRTFESQPKVALSGCVCQSGGRNVFSPDGFQCSASMYMGITGGSKTSLFFFFRLTSSLLPLQVGHSLSLAHPSCSSNSSSAQEYSPDSGSRSHYSLLHPLPLLLLPLLHLLVHQ